MTWSGSNVLRVPARSLFRAGGRWAAFAVRDGRARQVFLDLGEIDGTLTVVTRGLTEGEVVIAQPTDAVIDGTRVRG